MIVIVKPVLSTHYLNKKRSGDSCLFSNSAFRANHSVNQMMIIRLLWRCVILALVHLLTCYVTSLSSPVFFANWNNFRACQDQAFLFYMLPCYTYLLIFWWGWDERGTTITLRGSFGFCCAIHLTISWHDPLFVFFFLLHFLNVAAWAVQKL